MSFESYGQVYLRFLTARADSNIDNIEPGNILCVQTRIYKIRSASIVVMYLLIEELPAQAVKYFFSSISFPLKD